MKAANKANAKDVYQAFSAHLKVSSGESINPTFVKVALSLFKVMQHASVREVLLLGAELFGKNNPLTNSLYKIEALMQACGSEPAKFSTMLAYMLDLILNGELQAWECSWGPLTGKQQNNNKGTLAISSNNCRQRFGILGACCGHKVRSEFCKFINLYTWKRSKIRLRLTDSPLSL